MSPMTEQMKVCAGGNLCFLKQWYTISQSKESKAFEGFRIVVRGRVAMQDPARANHFRTGRDDCAIRKSKTLLRVSLQRS